MVGNLYPDRCCMPSPCAQNICLYVVTASDHILIEFRGQ